MNTIFESYEINQHTLALLPARHIDYETIVLQNHDEWYVRQTPLEIIQRACLEGGSSYDGRRKAVIHFTGAKKKVPIPINPWKNIYAFPTHSPHLFECSWIFQPHIRNISPSPKDPQTTVITFYNGKKIEIPISHYSMKQQMLRTATCILRFSSAFYETQNSKAHLLDLPFKSYAKI